jgi:hypothetical protein
MALFNSEITYETVIDHIDLNPSLRIAHIYFDDAYGIRRHHEIEYLEKDVDHVKIGGTASTSVTIYTGIVIQPDHERDRLMVVANGKIIECVFSSEESFLTLLE